MPRSVWVGTGRGHEPGARTNSTERTGSGEKVGETGLSWLTVCLLAVPGRPRLREVIPLLTTNLFSRAPPACSEVKRRREGGKEKNNDWIQYVPGRLPQVCIAGRWVADRKRERERERERGWDVLDKHVLREGRQEVDREKKTNRPREVTQVERIWNLLHYGKTKNNNC